MMTFDKLLNFYEIPTAIRALYDSNHGATGGCLHIVLDDGNTGAQHVAWCVNSAVEQNCHHGCYTLGLSLLALRDDEQRDAVLRAAGYAGSNVA